MVTYLGIWCYLYLEIPPIPTSLTFQVQLKQCWASLTAQLVKNLPAMQEILVQLLIWEDLLEKG